MYRYWQCYSSSLTHILFSNLFATDYLKDHPDTTSAEFKLIYDGIAADVKKVSYPSVIYELTAEMV